MVFWSYPIPEGYNSDQDTHDLECPQCNFLCDELFNCPRCHYDRQGYIIPGFSNFANKKLSEQELNIFIEFHRKIYDDYLTDCIKTASCLSPFKLTNHRRHRIIKGNLKDQIESQVRTHLNASYETRHGTINELLAKQLLSIKKAVEVEKSGISFGDIFIELNGINYYIESKSSEAWGNKDQNEYLNLKVSYFMKNKKKEKYVPMIMILDDEKSGYKVRKLEKGIHYFFLIGDVAWLFLTGIENFGKKLDTLATDNCFKLKQQELEETIKQKIEKIQYDKRNSDW